MCAIYCANVTLSMFMNIQVYFMKEKVEALNEEQRAFMEETNNAEKDNGDDKEEEAGDSKVGVILY